MRVLLVEDDPSLTDAVRRGLAEQGYAVDAVSDGQAALEYALGAGYDVLILDVMLPGLDGTSVCRRLRAAGDATPVLMLTARASVDDRVAGLDSGADDYLAKPFAFRELLARLRALLRRPARAYDPVLRVADLELDPATRRVRRHGQAVELTNKEFAILELFLRHPDQVLTRTQIADRIWDEGFMAVSNVVEVYVGLLRRKLGDTSEPRLLETVRGAGYRLRTQGHPRRA
jgi:DNA-binding response OmpR family regulator